MANALKGLPDALPDVQGLLGQVMGQIQPAMQGTQDQMGALQDYIKSQQKDQLNIPALQFAAGLLKPTRTGSFAESVGEAGEGALGALQKQRSIDLDRQAKILELQQAKQGLLTQQAQMLLPFAQMNMTQNILGGTDTGDGGGGGAAAGDAKLGAQKFKDYTTKINRLAGWNPPVAKIQQGLMDADPDVAAYKAGMVKGSEKAAEAPYELVEVKMPDGSMAKVPLSSIVHPAKPAIAAPAIAPPAAGAPATPPIVPGAAPAASVVAAPGLPGAVQTGPSAAQTTGLEMAGTEAKKIPDSLVSLEQQDQRMQAIDEVLEKYQTGQYAEPKANALAALRGLGFNVKDTDTANPAALQEFRKNSIGEMFDKVKELSAGGGGQIKVAELTGMGKIVTDPELQPEANQAIAAQIRGVIDWKKQMMTDYASDYSAGKIKDPSPWQVKWDQEHPLGKYVADRLAKTPVMGVPVDKVANGALGIADKNYSDPNGNVAVQKGEKFMKIDNHMVPLSKLDAYYSWKAQH